MPIRNPFARRPGPAAVQDENQRPGSAAGTLTPDAAHPGFERVDTVGSKASSAFSIHSSRKSQDTGEYKMSVVNDSGVYLPPSPVEREPTWPRRYLSRTSSDNKSPSFVGSGGDIEHFPISRESFDSYRRSFDISAKSPITTSTSTTRPRQSLDSSLHPHHVFSPRFPRSSLSDQRRWVGGGGEPPTPEESETGEEEDRSNGRGEGGFEEVGLGGDGDGDGGGDGGGGYDGGVRQESVVQQVPAKKRGFFAKFGGGDSGGSGGGHVEGKGGNGGVVGEEESGTAGTVMSRFLPLGGGRKRAQSGGQGAELGVMDLPGRAQGVEV